jgi:hypothetical protein
MTTAGTILNLALRDSGVLGIGQTAKAQDVTDQLQRWSMITAQWNRRRWLVYSLIDTAFVCTGALSYTVGAGGNFNIARPDRIEAAYIRQVVPSQPNTIDWPLQIIQSREEYSQIAVKNLAAAPSEALWYDSGFPLGRVYPWPLPNNRYELHILTKNVLQAITATSDVIALPPEYEQLLYTSAVNQLRAAYRLKPDPFYIGLQKAAEATVRKSNFQVGRLSMPRGLTPGPAYNVYSDRGS